MRITSNKRNKPSSKHINISDIDNAISEFVNTKVKTLKASFNEEVLHVIKQMHNKSYSSIDMAKFLNKYYKTTVYKPSSIRSAIYQLRARCEVV